MLKGPTATGPQMVYIDQLAIDLGFERLTRNAYITERVGRPIHYLDELTRTEARQVIDYFKKLKEGVA